MEILAVYSISEIFMKSCVRVGLFHCTNVKMLALMDYIDLFRASLIAIAWNNA